MTSDTSSSFPVEIGRWMRFLTPRDLEVELHRASLYSGEGWAAHVKKRGILFNLSKVEWVDLGALIQVVLLVESAIQNEIVIRLALPLARPRKSDEQRILSLGAQADSETIWQRIERRNAVLRFLSFLHFEEVLRPAHLSAKLSYLELFTEYEGDLGAASARRPTEALLPTRGDSRDSPEWAPGERLYRYCFPLHWCSTGSSEDMRQMAWFLAQMVGQPERGLESIDAKSIANVILYELVQNVARHAGTSANALVVAWARPPEVPPKSFNYPSCEQPYIDWLSRAKSPVVEIILGDSGRGIPKVLLESFRKARAAGVRVPTSATAEAGNVLLWAFDRWSSSRDSGDLRGTRGLYRVDRVVRKYQGLITARAENQLVGWDHGGAAYDVPVVESTALSYIPGTVIKLRIPAFREDTPVWRASVRVPGDLKFLRIRVDSLGPEGLDQITRTKLRRTLEEGRPDQPLCVVAALEANLGDPKGIEAMLRQAAELRHPAALIITGIPGGWDAIELAVQSVNSEHANRRRSHEHHGKEHFEIWDPVLIIGERGEQAWVGGNEKLLSLLRALFLSTEGVLSAARVEECLSQCKPRERAELLRSLRNDAGLASFLEDGSLQSQFTLPGLFEALSRSLQSHVFQGLAGVLGGGPYRTPSLLLVDKWLDTDKILASTCGSDLAMLALSARLREHPAWQGVGTDNVLISDQSVASPRIKQLHNHLGNRRFRTEIIPGETGMPTNHGVRLIARGASVIIYCDIILSGETTRRCLSQVLRDEATPLAIASLFDARGNDDSVEMWGVEVPVISLARIPMLLKQRDLQAEVINMNPVTREREEPAPPAGRKRHLIDRRSLANLIEKTNTLHFSHVGRPTGRHFTLYLNPGNLVRQPLIGEAFASTLETWISGFRASRSKVPVELWHPAQEPRPSASIVDFLDWVKSGNVEFVYKRTVRRETAYGRWTFPAAEAAAVRCPNVVIVDWGALTGSSVMQMVRLAAEAGAERILACILVSQLTNDDEAFLQSLDALRVLAPNHDEEQPSLPGFAPLVDRLVRVSVNFLSSLPLGVYTPPECPVCQQLARLGQEEYPTELLRSFARVQKEERLRPRVREDVVSDAPKDLDGRELTSERALWMAGFRERLSAALISTSGRYAVVEELEAVRNAVGVGISSPGFFLLHFLSVENQWLRVPPLSFRAVRSIVADIAQAVALRRDTDEFERLAAIAVLRSASKFRFARIFTEIFLENTSSEPVLQHILYDVFTYLSRPYHQTKVVLEPLREGLDRLKRVVDKRDIIVSEQVAETLERLSTRVGVEYAKVSFGALTPAKAWARLRKVFGPTYRRTHNYILRDMGAVLPGPDAELIDRDIALQSSGNRQLDADLIPWLVNLERHWNPCRQFLDYTVFPLLDKIKPILLSDDGKRSLGPDTVQVIISLLEGKSSLAEIEFSELVRKISKNPMEILSAHAWECIRSESLWFWERFLRYGDGHPPSRLIDLIDSCPVQADEVINRIDAELPRIAPEVDLDFEKPPRLPIFSTANLAFDSLSEIIGNCQKHKRGDAEGVQVRISIGVADGCVAFSVSNNNSQVKPREEQGEGLSLIEKRLAAFGATLKMNTAPGDGWSTFRATLEFLTCEEDL